MCLGNMVFCHCWPFKIESEREGRRCKKTKGSSCSVFTPRCLQSKGGGGLADCSSVIGRNGLWGRTRPCEGGKGGGGGMRAGGGRGRRDDVREGGRGKHGKGERGH